MADPTLQPLPADPAPAPVPQVSEKDKKADILAAYNELLQRYEQRASVAKNKELAAKKAKEETTVKTASGSTAETIVQGCRNLEGAMRMYLAELADNLLKELKRLKEVQDAIGIEEQRLQEIHDITVTAMTLAELIDTHKVKEKELEESHEKKLRELDEDIAHKKEEWKRSEEEHSYRMSLEKKREDDEHEYRRRSLERELEERRKAMALEEKDIEALRKRSAHFEEELEAAREHARKEAEKQVRAEEKVKADLLATKGEQERQIAAMKIASFEAKVSEQMKEIESLRVQLASTSREAKDIALKVIEGASGAATLRNLQRSAFDETRVAG